MSSVFLSNGLMDLNKSSSNILKMYCGLDIHKRKKYYASLIYKRMRITMNYCFYNIASRNVGLPPFLFVTTLLTLIVQHIQKLSTDSSDSEMSVTLTLPAPTSQLWPLCVWEGRGQGEIIFSGDLSQRSLGLCFLIAAIIVVHKLSWL